MEDGDMDGSSILPLFVCRVDGRVWIVMRVRIFFVNVVSFICLYVVLNSHGVGS